MNGSIEPNASIVDASLDDCEAIARHRYFQPGVSADATSAYVLWLQEALHAGTYLGWIAIQEPSADEHRVIGGCGLVLLNWGPTRDDLNPLRGRVVNMFVDPDFRRRGIARALLNRALTDAARIGLRTVSLGSSDMARALYESNGFKLVSTEMNLKLNSDEGPA